MKSFRNKLKSRKDDSNASPSRAESGAPAVGSAESPAASMAGEGVVNETPEVAAARLVRTFCMSDGNDAGAEVALLPSIVEAAESSPQAASECARHIRKFMHRDYWARPSFVYNAIMLMRILVENPGMTFTRNMDKKFVDAVRDVLRGCEHAHVVHFLIEAMQELEAKSTADEGVGRMTEMWRKEKEREKAKSKSTYAQPPPQQVQQGRSGFWQRPQPAWHQPHQPYQPYQLYQPYQPYQPYQQAQQAQQMPVQQESAPTMTRAERRHGSSATLPKPRELRKRLDEAKTTAGVLADVVNTTAPSALLKHDLADDLVARCRRASGQVLEYLDTKDPFPDNHEMAALLSTHEALQQTVRHYYGAVLEARKAVSIGETRRAEDGSMPMEMTPAGKGKANAPLSPVAGGASGSNGHSNGRDSPRNRDRDGNDNDSNFGRNEDDDMIAAAIAASVAPGANARPGHRGYGQQYEGGGPANESDNPFSDHIQAESSRSSSHARPSYGGGGSSSTAAGGAGSSSLTVTARPVAYANSGDDSDEEYLRHRQRNKGVAGGSSSAGGEGSACAGSSSQEAPAAGPAEVYAPPSGPPPPRPAATGSSSHGAAEPGGPSGSGSGPSTDTESGGQYPVYRY